MDSTGITPIKSAVVLTLTQEELSLIALQVGYFLRFLLKSKDLTLFYLQFCILFFQYKSNLM